MTGSEYRERACLRNKCERPVMYADCDTICYYDGKVYNRSVAGVYFVSARAPKLESDIFIKPKTHLIERFGQRGGLPSRAKVIWCREIERMDEPCFGVGVQYMVNSHVNTLEASYACDLCGERISFDDIRRMEGEVFSCGDCFERLRDLPRGKVSDSLNEFLSGNVL